MPLITGRALISLALTELGVLPPGREATAPQAQHSLQILNALSESMGLTRAWLFEQIRTVKVLASGTASYTVGSGGDINITRPDFLDRCALIIDNTQAVAAQQEKPLGEPLSLQRWNSLPDKGLRSGLVEAVYYDYAQPSTARATITLWPVPNVGTTSLVLYHPGVAVPQFADFATPYVVGVGYLRALYKLLALELCPAWGKEPSMLLLEQASEARADILVHNSARLYVEVATDAVMVGGGRATANILSGDIGTR